MLPYPWAGVQPQSLAGVGPQPIVRGVFTKLCMLLATGLMPLEAALFDFDCKNGQRALGVMPSCSPCLWLGPRQRYRSLCCHQGR